MNYNLLAILIFVLYRFRGIAWIILDFIDGLILVWFCISINFIGAHHVRKTSIFYRGRLRTQSFISDIPDPRQQSKVAYPLDEILLLCLVAVIAGCDSFVEIAEYGVEKLEFLRNLADFESGIPSHDTLSAVFRQLDPLAFSGAFSNWALSLGTRFEGRIVAIDGKTSRGSKAGGTEPLHMISAFCDDMRLVLGQRASDHKKNEIKDIPKLLEILYLKGAIVTIDAMGCQTKIVQ